MTQKKGLPFIIVNYFAFMAIKAYLLHFSYELLYFVEVMRSSGRPVLLLSRARHTLFVSLKAPITEQYFGTPFPGPLA